MFKNTKFFCICSNDFEVTICKFMLKFTVDKNPNIDYIPLNIHNYPLNEYVNEVTALLYLYEHQELLKNAQYIGLCHYRRIFNDLNNEYIKYLDENESNYILGCIDVDEAFEHKKYPPRLDRVFFELSETTKINWVDIINNFSEIYPEYSKIRIDKEITNYHYFMPTYNIFILSRNNFIKLCRFYTLFIQYIVNVSTGKNDISVDNFDYFIKYKCLQIDRFDDKNYTPYIGIKEEIIDKNAPLPHRSTCKRFFGYISEFITAWYLLHVLGNNYKICNVRYDNYILDYGGDDYGYRKLILNEGFDESTLEGWDK